MKDGPGVVYFTTHNTQQTTTAQPFKPLRKGQNKGTAARKSTNIFQFPNRLKVLVKSRPV